MNRQKMSWSMILLSILALSSFAEDTVKISSGNTVGTYYATSSAVAKMSNKDRTNSEPYIMTMPSHGSLNNIENVLNGTSHFGLAQANLLEKAVLGEGPWEGKPQKKLKAVLKLYTEDVTIVVADQDEVNSIADLKGKRVNIGKAGSSDAVHFRALLLEAGIEPSELTIIEKAQSMSQDLMKNEEIDAYIFTVGHPAFAVRNSSSGEEKIKLLPLDKSLIEAVLKINPLVKATSIPVAHYPNILNKTAVPSVGVHAVLFTTDDTSEETVHRMVKSVMKNIELFQRQHPALQKLGGKAMSDISFMEVHPGAQEYFKEAGLVK